MFVRFREKFARFVYKKRIKSREKDREEGSSSLIRYKEKSLGCHRYGGVGFEHNKLSPLKGFANQANFLRNSTRESERDYVCVVQESFCIHKESNSICVYVNEKRKT